MNLQAAMLVVTGLGAVAGGVLLGRRAWWACALIAAGLVAVWVVALALPQKNVSVLLQAITGVLVLVAAGLMWQRRLRLGGALLAVATAVTWATTYWRMTINDWVAGDNSEKLYWFGLLGEFTSWGMVAMGLALVIGMLAVPRQA